MAVRTDRGNPAVVIVRAKVSTTTIKDAPKRAHAGRTLRWLFPNIIRHICGTSKPTQPTCPLIVTQEAVISEAESITTVRRSLIFTPLDFASSSFNGNKFNLHLSKIRMITPKRITGAPIARLS